MSVDFCNLERQAVYKISPVLRGIGHDMSFGAGPIR